MEEKNILTYLTNNHLTKNQLVEKYNEKIKQKSYLENEFNNLAGKYNELNERHENLQKYSQELTYEFSTLKKKYENFTENSNGETINILIEMNNELEKRYYDTVEDVKGNIAELLDVIDDMKCKINNNEYLLCMGYLKKINDVFMENDTSDDE